MYYSVGEKIRKYYKLILETSEAQTTSLSFDGMYDIILVGAGGGGSNSWNNSTPSESACAGGGSGSYIHWVGQLNGRYTLTIGKGGNSAYTTNYYANIYADAGGDTSIGDVIVAGGGLGGSTGMDRWATKGEGGTSTFTISGVEDKLNGLSGTAFGSSYGVASGGASVYNGYGKGGSAGAGAAVESGANGYIKIVKETNSSDYDYYIDSTIYKFSKINDKYYVSRR